MTRFKNILKRTYRADEEIHLMKLQNLDEEDELGFAKQKYVPIKKLCGIIQGDQDLDIDDSGQESHPGYIAYLMPTFDLERENLNDFRIKYVRPYETMILKIMSYDPNLFLRHKRHHVTLILLLEKKYVE